MKTDINNSAMQVSGAMMLQAGALRTEMEKQVGDTVTLKRSTVMGLIENTESAARYIDAMAIAIGDK